MQFAGAKVGAIFKMEDEKENLSLLQQTFFLETSVYIFGKESSKEPEILKELEFLTG